MIITEGQERDNCEKSDAPCTTDTDCNSDLNGTCVVDSGYCSQLEWCPTESNETSETFYTNPDAFSTWFKGAISFP